MALINCPECSGNLSDQASVCPHCGYPVRIARESSGSESGQQKKKEPFAAFFMRVIAWVLWIGGLIIAVVTSINSRSNQGADWVISMIVYGISGGFAWAVGEVFDNIQGIHDMLQLPQDGAHPQAVGAAASAKEKLKNFFAEAAIPEESAVPEKTVEQEKMAASGKYDVSETPAMDENSAAPEEAAAVATPSPRRRRHTPEVAP